MSSYTSGALRKTVLTGYDDMMNEWMKHICPCFTQPRIALAESARGRHSRNSVSSAARYAFNPFFFSLEQEIYDIHATWFDCFSRRKGNRAALQ